MDVAAAAGPRALEAQEPPSEESIRLEAAPHPIVPAGGELRVTLSVAEPHLVRLLGATVRLAFPAGLEPARESLVVAGRKAEAAEARELCERGLRVEGAGETPWTATLAVRVDPTIPDGSVLAVRAELLAGGDRGLGSANLELFVRARPALENARSVATLAVAPGDAEGLVARLDVHNAGPSAARDVVVRLPAPDGCVLVPVPGGPDPDGGPLALGSLDPGATATLHFRARLVAPPRSGIVGWSGVAVACADAGEYRLPACAVALPAPAAFEGPATSLLVEPDGPLAYGERVVLRLRAANGGAPATEVQLRLVLPSGLRYAPGSARLCGEPLPAAGRDAALVGRLPGLAPGESAELEAAAYVVARRDEDSVIRGELRWGTGGVRTLAHALALRAGPRFAPRVNRIEPASPTAVEPGDAVAFLVRLRNSSPAPAPATSVRLEPVGLIGLALDLVAGARLEPDGTTLELGTLAAWATRSIRVSGRAEPSAEAGCAGLGGRIVVGGAEQLVLAPATIALRAEPRLDAVTCAHDDDEPLRPGARARLRISAGNVGTAPVRGVRVAFDLPAGLALEPGSEVGLGPGEIAPGETWESSVALRVGAVRSGALAIRGRIEAEDLFATPFPTVWIPTSAQAELESSRLALQPGDTVAPGDTVTVALELVNSGDGAAERVAILARTLETALYVAGSTTLDGVAAIDRGTGLFGREGLVLEDVAPGTTSVIRWRLHVCGRDGESLAPRVELVWDRKRRAVLHAPALSIADPDPAATAGLELAFRTPGLALRRTGDRPPDRPVAGPPPNNDAAAYLIETDDGTFAAHVLALRALFPGPATDGDRLAELRAALHDVLDRLAIKLRIPELVPGPRDVEDRRLREAFLAVDSEARGELAAAPRGGPATFAALAALLPADAPDPRLAAALAAYRDGLRAAFAAADPEPDAFSRSLREASPPGLDRLRAAVVAALGAA